MTELFCLTFIIKQTVLFLGQDNPLSLKVLRFSGLGRTQYLQLIIKALHVGCAYREQRLDLLLYLQCALSKLRQPLVTGTDGNTLANQLKLLAELLQVGLLRQLRQTVDDLD